MMMLHCLDFQSQTAAVDIHESAVKGNVWLTVKPCKRKVGQITYEASYHWLYWRFTTIGWCQNIYITPSDGWQWYSSWTPPPSTLANGLNKKLKVTPQMRLRAMLLPSAIRYWRWIWRCCQEIVYTNILENCKTMNNKCLFMFFLGQKTKQTKKLSLF